MAGIRTAVATRGPASARPTRLGPWSESQRRRAGRRLPALATALVALTLATVGLGSGAAPAAAAAYDGFHANFQGEELMRAINADRAARGLARFAADPGLAAIARDRSTPCPSDPALTVRGRARDMADRDYLAHAVKDCKDATGDSFSSFDLLAEFGVTWSSAGENIARNNYPATKVDYATGCSMSGGGCAGTIALPRSVAVAERGWMSSSAHRSVLLSTTFVRFGCAAWGAGNDHVYACYFVAGGNGSVDRTGPALTHITGVGEVFAAGSRPTFTATARDSASLLADGRAYVDGNVVDSWAHHHDGSTEDLVVVAPRLSAGKHTFRWWVRDTSTNVRSVEFEFTIKGSPTRAPTTPPAPPPPSHRATPTPPPAATPSPAVTAATDAPAATGPPAAPGAGPSPTADAVPGAGAALARRAVTQPGGPAPGDGWIVPVLAAVVLLAGGVLAARRRPGIDVAEAPSAAADRGP